MSHLDVLAIAAHPDDAEVGCGGALLLAADAGLRTGVVDLTLGEAATRGTPFLRGHERDRATALLRLDQRMTLGFPDTAVGTDPAHRLALIELLRRCQPRIVIAPYPEDRHPDHAAAGRLAREACFLARVRNTANGPPHKAAHLYHYMLHQPFVPSFVIDTSRVWERRMEAVTAYESQFGHAAQVANAVAAQEGVGTETEISDPQFLRYLEARAIFYGAMVGARWGEPYFHAGPLSYQGLPGVADATPVPRAYSMFY